MRALGVIIAALAVASAVASAFLLSNYDDQGVSGQPTRQIVLPVSFANATNLTNNDQDSVYGQVAAWDSSAYVTWQDSVPFDRGNYDIYLMKSKDEGASFGQAINLSNNSGFSEHPQISVYQNSVYVIWADNTPGNREVLFAKSADNATSFGDVVNLSEDSSDSFNQEVAASGDSVYVVWLDEGDGSRVLFRASSDGGASFGRTMAISDSANSETFPKVAADGNNVYVTWNVMDDEGRGGLFYAKSSDGGQTFGDAIKLNKEDNFGESQIVVGDGSVHVVSGGLHTAEVNGLLLAESADGSAFDLAQLDANGTFVNPLNVEVVAANGTLYVAGQVFNSGNEEILLMPVDSSGPLGTVNLSKNEGISECPSIAMAGDNIYVVWEDLTPGNHEVLFAKGKVREMGFEPTNP